MTRVALVTFDVYSALFDIAGDPSESRDLASAQPETVARLKSVMDRMNSEMVPPLWGRR